MKILFAILVFFPFASIVLSQEESVNGELWIVNRDTNHLLKVAVYPVGLVFNGAKEYKMRATVPQNSGDSFIVGNTKEYIDFGERMSLDVDIPTDNNADDGLIGYGKYRIDFYERGGNPVNWIYTNYCYVDFSHSNYPWVSEVTSIL